MTETYQATDPDVQPPSFLPDHEVSIKDLRFAIAPQNSMDLVEEARLRLVGAHVTELLRSDLPEQEARIHENSIYNLGAEAVLECLPERHGRP